MSRQPWDFLPCLLVRQRILVRHGLSHYGTLRAKRRHSCETIMAVCVSSEALLPMTGCRSALSEDVCRVGVGDGGQERNAALSLAFGTLNNLR
jgi:hypothetical protein